MDQVITFLNKQLELFTMDGERLLTPSMINNYVKDGVLPRPVQKKYGREPSGHAHDHLYVKAGAFPAGN